MSKAIHSSFWSNVFKKAPIKSELFEALKEMPPFAGLKTGQLNEIISLIHSRSYIAGEYIFHQNDPGIGLYIIDSGEVQIEYTSPMGNKIVLANFKKGDFFGELALLDGERRSASAIALTDCRISVLFKPDLDSFIVKNPKEGLAILSGIAKIIVTRLRNLNNEYFSLYESLNLNDEVKNVTGNKKDTGSN